MNSRERVLAAIDHREPDATPIDFGAMRSTGIMAIAYNKLKKHLGITTGETFVYDVMQQLAEPEPWILERFQADVEQLHRYRPAFNAPLRGKRAGVLPDGSPATFPEDFRPVVQDGVENVVIDGQVVARRPLQSLYFESDTFHPLENARAEKDLDAVKYTSLDDEEFAWLKRRAAELRASTARAITGHFGGNFFEAGHGLFGYGEFLMRMAAEPNLVRALFDRLLEGYLADLKRYIEAVGDNIDIIICGDDLGTQGGLAVSPAMYRDLIKPYEKKFFGHIKSHTNWKLFLHTCGSIYPVIRDLIEVGVDILNPVQTAAKDMQPARLKSEFGRDVTFWGGGGETQSTLAFGTPQEVRREARERLRIFSPGGGYVFNQVHNIQANVPPENVVALYDAAIKFRNIPATR
jgi:uroporphyrinogen decarboxylase